MSRLLLKKILYCLVLGASFLITTHSHATSPGTFTFESSDRKTDTLVLFTSQGCSSCPPAEKWLNSYNRDPKLWETRIPLAFHVDYWDYLGWEDPFAKNVFSTLQRDYARQGHFTSVYTPGIAINNHEFREWFYGKRKWAESSERPGVLTVEVAGKVFRAGFESSQEIPDNNFELHTAWLGMGVTTRVTAGENKGRELEHDFVVLDYKNHGETLNQSVPLDMVPELGQASSVMVVWVTRPDSVEIIQAAAYPI